MRVVYLNDRKMPAKVFVGSDMCGQPILLQPGCSRTFLVDVPDGFDLFVKVWEAGTVFISWSRSTTDTES